jgi:drug/metabolite transporter (DMT)-like permease
MDWLWIPITIAAALAQNLRTAVQKHLKGKLSTNGANYTRFVYGVPLAIAYLLLVRIATGETLPSPHLIFLGWTLIGGVAQIIATSLLIETMSRRNFAAGIAYSKTEAVQAAIFEALVLGTAISAGGVAAIVVATAGVMFISLAKSESPWRDALAGWSQPTLLLGLASGGFFGISAVGFRAASLSLEHPHFLVSAGYTLAWSQAIQTALLGAWLVWREPGQLTAVRRNWRIASLAGVTGTIASIGWFTAMTLQAVAYVRTLGLVELLFTFAIARFVFKETPSRNEILGMAMLALGIALLLNWR